MNRQAAFENSGKMLKGALHCHTTRSDGQGTPEEVIAKHYAHGYDFMALTDHRCYNYNHYGDLPMTIIPGMEMDGTFTDEAKGSVHCHHTVCIGPEKGMGNGFEQDECPAKYWPEKPEDTQPILDEIHAKGNMTIYCHPEWSGTAADDFRMLRGNFAMEIWNSGCAMENGIDTDAAYWDELLTEGQKIFGVATDDGHSMDQHCVGWVRVSSGNSVPEILEALKAGRFYSSCGPEIYDFYVENGRVCLKCSPVVSIQMRHLRRPYRIARPAEGEETLTEASFPLYRCTGAPYVRAVVTDAQGRKAWTNPIFLNEEDFVD